ncbi:MAG: RNA polymerase sigma factor [Gammaproteobacteria bacterium]|nr:RNA polymerase sigma factor [Gammaproteobacteria bacterium]
MSDHVYQQVVVLMPKLRRFAYGLSGSVENADDLIQEACTRLLSCMSEVEGYLERWLYRTIRNLHIDQVRRMAVKSRCHDDLAGRQPASTDGNLQVESLITLRQVRDLIGELPEDQRVTLLLVGVEGYSYREASELLGLPIGTVTSRVARARQKLTDAIYPNHDRETEDLGEHHGSGSI